MDYKKRWLYIHFVFASYLKAFMCMFNFLLKSSCSEKVNTNDCPIFKDFSLLRSRKDLLSYFRPSVHLSGDCAVWSYRQN